MNNVLKHITIKKMFIFNIIAILLTFLISPLIYLKAQKEQNLETIKWQHLIKVDNSINDFINYDNTYFWYFNDKTLWWQYLSRLDMIIINWNLKNNGNDSLRSLLLHEYIHVITHKELNYNKKVQLFEKLEKLYILINKVKVKYLDRKDCWYSNLIINTKEQQIFLDNIIRALKYINLENIIYYQDWDKFCATFYKTYIPIEWQKNTYLESYKTKGYEKLLNNYLSYSWVSYQSLDEFATYFFQSFNVDTVNQLDLFFNKLGYEEFEDEDLNELVSIYKDIYILFLRDYFKKNLY